MTSIAGNANAAPESLSNVCRLSCSRLDFPLIWYFRVLARLCCVTLVRRLSLLGSDKLARPARKCLSILTAKQTVSVGRESNEPSTSGSRGSKSGEKLASEL